MKKHQSTIGDTDTWLTPPEILAPLGRFDLDPACPHVVRRPIAGTCYSPKKNGLKQRWFGRVWLNPPFNRYERPKWMAKMAAHGNGIMLVPAATETVAFEQSVWKRADAVCFLRGRPHFHNVRDVRSKANCGCSIVLVAYGHRNAMALEDCGLGQTLILNRPLTAA